MNERMVRYYTKINDEMRRLSYLILKGGNDYEHQPKPRITVDPITGETTPAVEAVYMCSVDNDFHSTVSKSITLDGSYVDAIVLMPLKSAAKGLTDHTHVVATSEQIIKFKERQIELRRGYDLEDQRLQRRGVSTFHVSIPAESGVKK